MKKVISFIAVCAVLAPTALAACSWAWCPGIASGCSESPTWDCNQGGCGANPVATDDLYMCQIQTGNLCCECRMITRECTGDGCLGYAYFRYRREVAGGQCTTRSATGHGTWCGAAPGGGGGGS